MPASPELEDLRHRVRTWCAANVPRDWRTTTAGADPAADVAFQRAWLTTLAAGGWAVPHWPAAYGGGRSLPEQAVIYEELARADAPRLSLHFVSLHHAAATLIHAGTPAQRERHLPAILDGELWCQGFSEPNAGSDLAALQAVGRPEGDHFVVNGQKTWSSAAAQARWCLLLVRTAPEAPKRKGISYLLLDLRSDGVEIRPIRNARGDAHFCEIFLTDVRIPRTNLIGAENDGWRVAQATLNTERGATMVELVERLRTGLGWLTDQLRAAGLLDDPDSHAAVRVTRFAAELRALRELVLRSLSPTITDAQAGILASMTKLAYSELLQDLTGFATDVSPLAVHLDSPLSAHSGWESGAWLLDFIGSWEWTIPGGTSEIQRTIIAERGLGLPREGAS
ncbi:acyl-CoA dehydrogenase family protein [Nocardioides carbamazepini]|uniref:acyl-CoA dehydrogenase family protein n=1 Tax=Nocardioides carbamazepini TaxID=2854259 RepID=UPI00214A5544|nr:acyl-CoA dehydrogenase family protein [Nocardioides carbamazepini]MCR1785062.1 acyl-CoA dehydrogenase family protein [Nocardioides carbamazepini]